jgi:site-specific recombinase XerD
MAAQAVIPAPPDAVRALAPRGPADRHPAAVYLASLAPGSRRAMRQALDVCAGIISSGRDDAETLDWAALRFQHTSAIRAALAERYAPAGANKALAALRGTLKAAWRLGLVDAETYHRAADVPTVRGERPLAGRALSAGELAALFRVCGADARANGRRDAALLAVLYAAGLRRSEATGLDVADYDAEAGTLRVRHGKGGKVRVVPLNPQAQAALGEWLAARGNEPGSLFQAVDQAGRIRPGPMSSQAVALMLRRRGRQAHLVRPCSPHDFRRTFVSDLLDLGTDLVTVQKLAGHSNVTTTARYDRRPAAAQTAAAARLHVPFVSANGDSHKRYRR